MSVELDTIVATLKGDTKDFEASMARSNQELLALGAGSVAMGNLATQAFNYFAAGAINAVSALHRWAGESSAALERTQNLSMQLGMSTRTLQGWGMAAAHLGLDINAFAGGMSKLSKHIEELGSGNERSIALFAQLKSGLSAVDVAGLGTEGTMRLVADRFKAMPDGVEKTRLAVELFGRAGIKLIPILNQGSEGLDKATRDAEKFGVVLTHTQEVALGKYDQAVDNMTSALEGFKNTVAAAFAPSLTRTIEMMTSAVSYAKSIFQAFADAAEKLFIRFGAIAAVIEIVGKQIFSLSVLNKEAWQQTMQQVEAIDKWAAAEIKAVDATKNAAAEMGAAKTQAKEYTVSQKALGEQIVAATQIQIKAHQEAKQAVLDRMAAEIELGIRQKNYAAEVSKEVFGEIFEAEERRMKDAYAGSSVMIENITTKLKALRDTHEDIQKWLDSNTKAYIDEAMAADAALVAQTAAEVEADRKNEQYQGAYIVRQEQARQAMLFGWKDVFGSMSQSAHFAFGQIRSSFGNTIVAMTQGTADWKQLWQTTQGALLNSAVQWGIDIVGSYIAKNAMILATESATALGVNAIWTASSDAVMDAMGLLTGSIADFFVDTIIPMFVTIGTAVIEFLSALATAEAMTIFGIPFSVATLAGIALIVAAIATISAFAFGAFAEGGIITKPTMALMGEAGPEAVIPLDKLSMLNGGGSSTIVIELDGRTIARSVFDHLPSVMRIRGVSA